LARAAETDFRFFVFLPPKAAPAARLAFRMAAVAAFLIFFRALVAALVDFLLAAMALSLARVPTSDSSLHHAAGRR
jgi:hypothetical protein